MRLSRIVLSLFSVLLVGVAGLVGPSAVAGGDHHPPGHGQHAKGLRVDGAVEHRLRLSADDLAALPQQSVTTTYSAGGTPTTATFTGPSLLDVLNAAGPRFDADVKNDALAFAVRATGSDRYQAVVAWGEIDPGFEAKQVLVATTENGAPLAKPRLVVPGDKKGGRYVSDLVSLRLLDLRGR